MRWFQAALCFLAGTALLLLGAALFDHYDLNFDPIPALAILVGLYFVLRAVFLFWKD